MRDVSSSPDRRALVTGASSGIGEATVRLLASEGYRVALLARRADVLARLVDELPGGSERHLVLTCDVRDDAQIEAACAELARRFGGIDLLVNNAGFGYRARVEELDPQLLRSLFDTNVLAVLLVSRVALPLLRTSPRAVVVNVASVVGRRGIPGQAAYSASKAAVVSIGEAMRLEWARESIAVCTLNPALTATGFFEAQPNPSGLPKPDMSRSSAPRHVAEEILALDRRPRPEVSMRWKWRMLAWLSVLAPRLADRVLADRIEGRPRREDRHR
jgi:NAD(P)-dependent dehydrogenase (short-subunit alcohol dehydrogenase family)